MNNELHHTSIIPVTAEEIEAMQALVTPTPQVQETCTTPTPTLEDVINNICSQLQLLATVIKQQQGNSLSPDQTMQECVQLVLQQSTWFEGMIDRKIEDANIEDMVKDRVEDEVNEWFSHSFSLTDHVDIDDLIQDEVNDKLDDVVGEKLDEKLQELVDEKFRNADISISFN
jgi:hypothetical protein